MEQIIQVLEKEDCRLHLRKPNYSESEYETLLKTIPAKFHTRIVLHDYFHLSEKYELGGIHFSTKKRSLITKSPNHQISKLTLSTSTHSFEEMKSLDDQFDYVFLSPIFPSISKQGYEGNMDMQKVQVYLQEAHKTKVIALGGIDESKIPQLMEWGFDGYAKLGSIWNLK